MLSREFFAIFPGLFGKVVLQTLCARLADVELGTNLADRRNPVRRKLLGEHLGRMPLQRVLTVPPRGHAVIPRAMRCEMIDRQQKP